MSLKAIMLFSGGLDSILAAKILRENSVEVKCVHFTSPFFGDASRVSRWSDLYDLDIVPVDISERFVRMLLNKPAHGFGKHLNPCIDCKIMMLNAAKAIMAETGADFIATGEVAGQRPMSQGSNMLAHILKKAAAEGLVLRPLSAGLLPAANIELEGRLGREGLLSISGRGRQKQLALAEKYNLQEIPSPAGGCLLTEKENSRRYWQILKNAMFRENLDMIEILRALKLVSIGRQFFNQGEQLCVGRNSRDNEALANLAGSNDLFLKLADMPGPLGLTVNGREWPRALIADAAAKIARHAPKARDLKLARVKVFDKAGNSTFINAQLCDDVWGVPEWEEARAEIKCFQQGTLETVNSK